MRMDPRTTRSDLLTEAHLRSALTELHQTYSRSGVWSATGVGIAGTYVFGVYERGERRRLTCSQNTPPGLRSCVSGPSPRRRHEHPTNTILHSTLPQSGGHLPGILSSYCAPVARPEVPPVTPHKTRVFLWSFSDIRLIFFFLSSVLLLFP